MSTPAPWKPLRSPICFYGGKGLIARHIIPLLPPHEIYLEPFFGGGSVFFAKSPAHLETINDVDQAVVEFYRVLRDPASFTEFARLVELTPYSRVEYETCRSDWREEADPVRRAWAWFVVARQAYGGGARGETGWKVGVGRSPKTNSWQKSVGAPDSSAGSRWLSAVDGLEAVHRRLQGVQIECGDWLHVLNAYQGPATLAYLDPPYVLQTRRGGSRYAHEMTLEAHEVLIDCLLDWQGMAVLSGYYHEGTHNRLEESGWERVDLDVAVNVVSKRDGSWNRRVESLWSNPAAVAARSQPSLFSGSEEVPR